MNIRIEPKSLEGQVERVISSKSQAHRLLICAALGGRPVSLSGVTFSKDVEATCRCLKALGAEIALEGEELRVVPGRVPEGRRELDCGESGSTLRFLLPVAAVLGAEADFTGRGKLAERPLSPLAEEMTAHGVSLSAPGTFPLACRGRLSPGTYTLAGNVSSQFFSGLLMALPLAAGDSLLRVEGRLESAPYVEMTLDALRSFGVTAERTAEGFRIPGGQAYRGPERLRVEGDWSGAAFWLAAGALSRGSVTCGNLNLRSSQGDREMAALLRGFGAEVTESGDRVTVRGGKLRGMELDAADIPDLVPILAVTAACAEGDTVIRRIARLRLKESDRVESVLALLRALGAEAEASGQEMRIHGRGGFGGGTVDACGDHRIAMAAAIAACRASGPVTILGAEAMEKSYPGFLEEYTALGGVWEKEEERT